MFLFYCMEILSNSIDFLKGVGPSIKPFLKKELNIFTYKDLLYYFPFRYIDKSKIYKISNLSSEMPYVQLKGKIIRFEDIGTVTKRLVCIFRTILKFYN